MIYAPHTWVVLKFTQLVPDINEERSTYKVLAGWRGGYLDGDVWRMNSGITKCVRDGLSFRFHGYSGSEYVCNKNYYGFSSLTSSIFNQLEKEQEQGNYTVEVVDDNSDWENIEY